MESKQDLKTPQAAREANHNAEEANHYAENDQTEKINQLASPLSSSLRTLRTQEVTKNITTFIEQLPSTQMNESAQKHARSYLNTMMAKSPEEANRALTAIKTVNAIVQRNSRHSDGSSESASGPKVSSSILSATSLIKVVADLNLTGAEVKAVAELAIAQERSVSRVGKFVKEYAASSTAQDKDLVFKSLPLEKRAAVLSDVEELTKHVRSAENSLPVGEKISLTTVEKLIDITGSVDVTLEMIDKLVEFPMRESAFAYMFQKGTNFHTRYNSILRYAIERMEETGSTSFDMEAFLTTKDPAASYDIEGFMENPRDEQEAFDEIISEDEFWSK